MANWHRLTEARIRKAEAEGTLSGLAGEGRLLPERPGDALIDPSDAVGYRIMAEAEDIISNQMMGMLAGKVPA